MALQRPLPFKLPLGLVVSKELWQGLTKVDTGGVATFVRNIIGTLVVVQGADILEQGVDDDDGCPAAGPVTAALSR